ncbi:MAG: hypothetical protein NC408_09690 [Candidatus Gastranaerophilales bacterium]|nr:hypothetical protein [Candidatus Gastranaerophilales bacterium]MCM1073783.1 hypothetical protein [Bacteroides sp.]
MKKIISSLLVFSIFSLYSGVYAETIKVKLPDNGYSKAAQYIEFDENTKVYSPQFNSQDVMNLGVVKIAKGTSLDVYMQEAVDTAYAEVGEEISAMLKEDLIIGESIVVPQGSFIKGKVIKARHAGRAGKNGKVSILFDKLILPEGESFNITAEQVDFEVNNEGSISSTAATVAGTILLGAAAGSVFKGSSDGYSGKKGKDYADGAMAGAIISGVVVVGYMLLQKGKDAIIPQYTEISVVLEDSLDIPVTGKY